MNHSLLTCPAHCKREMHQSRGIWRFGCENVRSLLSLQPLYALYVDGLKCTAPSITMPAGKESHMASTRTGTNQTVEQLLEDVRQLPRGDLLEFEKKFAAWRAQDGKAELDDLDDETLLARIKENSNLPASAQRRFNRLRHKRRAGALTEAEEKELQTRWRH